MTAKVTAADIVEAKRATGSHAYLWLHSSGDCILWACEDDSVDDDGTRAVERWQLDSDTVEELIDSGAVDDVA